MKKIAILLSFVILSFHTSFAVQRIWHLKIADTQAEEYVLREGAKSILNRMVKEVQTLALMKGDLKVIEVDMTGYDFNYKTIIKKLSALDCRGDLVVITIVGHGFRSNENDTNYPELTFGKSYGETLFFQDILFAVAEYAPSMILSVVTACNNNLGISRAEYGQNETIFANPPSPNQLTRNVNRYNELFRSYDAYTTKSITFLSSERGETTLFTKDGGYAFRAFSEVFAEALSQPYDQISWGMIGEKYRKKALVILKQEGYENQQHPSMVELPILQTISVKDKTKVGRFLENIIDKIRNIFKKRRRK